MLIGLYGGTFDPIHLGHTHAALSAREALQLPEIRMVLSARPGHRSAPAGETEHRWQMLCLACAEHPGLIADDVEIRREGTSYTVDTVAALRETEPDSIPCWIMGQDAFATLPVWYRWRSLLEFCNLIVVSRPGDVRAEPEELTALCQQHEVEHFTASELGQIYRLQMPMLEISATRIRRAIAHQEAVEHLLAPPVYTYIRQHRLYVNTENSF